MKILIVDDSIVFRSQIANALTGISGLEIAGTASNGRIAIQKLQQSPVDLITLDMEMPEMNGLETLKELRRQNLKPRVIVFSSQTLRGAEIALEALKEGADDVIAKPSGDDLNFDSALSAIKEALVPKVIQFIDGRLSRLKMQEQEPQSEFKKSHAPAGRYPLETPFFRRPINAYSPQMVVIASSTGGPAALEQIFSKIKGPFKVPVLIAQHMPPVFTQMLAKRLNDLTGVQAKEAEHDEPVLPNMIYVAPGNYHLRVARSGIGFKLQTNQDAMRNSVRPCADYLFESTAELLGQQCVGVVLTGMGEDGRDGALAIKKCSGGVLIQNKESSIVFGMPGAVFDCGAYDEVGDLDFIAHRLQNILT